MASVLPFFGSRHPVPLASPVGTGPLCGTALALTEALAGLAGAQPTAAYHANLMRAMRRRWSGPRRLMWQPFLAGTVVQLRRMAPSCFPQRIFEVAASVVGEAMARSAESPLDDADRLAIALLGEGTLPLLRPMVRESFLLDLLNLPDGAPQPTRLEAAERWLAGPALPLPWVALLLATQLAPDGHREEPFWLGQAPFHRLTRGFTAAAERQGITEWEGALGATRAFWDDVRGELLTQVIVLDYVEREVRALERNQCEVQRPPAVPAAPTLQRLEQGLIDTGRALAESENRAEELRRQASAAHREAAEARQARDRALERVRLLERECEALREIAAPMSVVQVGPHPDPARPVKDELGEEPLPAPTTDGPSEAEILEVLEGRTVYLFTGLERGAARQALAAALEVRGAICELFDGNRPSQLGPERYHPDALVVIETGHLGHSASEAIAARARASGVWFFVGRAGPGSLARRVAERWRATHCHSSAIRSRAPRGARVPPALE